MDLGQVTDIKELKAMAYDQLILQQQAENNLKLINQRIEQLAAEQIQTQTKKANS